MRYKVFFIEKYRHGRMNAYSTCLDIGWEGPLILHVGMVVDFESPCGFVNFSGVHLILAIYSNIRVRTERYVSCSRCGVRGQTIIYSYIYIYILITAPTSTSKHKPITTLTFTPTSITTPKPIPTPIPILLPIYNYIYTYI